MEKKSETSSTWVSELEKSEAELGPQENEEVPVVRLWPEPLREEGQQKPPSDQQSTIVASAIREAIRELREEQSIHFETESDEKFAVGYLYKTIMIPTARRVDLPGPIDRDVEPAAAGSLGRRITQRIIEAIGSTGQPESAEDALTRLLAALMEAQAARGRAEGQLLQQQDAQLRQEQDVVTDLRNKVQMLATERDGLLAAVNELKKGAGHGQLSARSQVGDRVQQPITGRWGTVMEVQGGRTLVRWDGAIAKPDGEDAEEESDEGASW